MERVKHKLVNFGSGDSGTRGNFNYPVVEWQTLKDNLSTATDGKYEITNRPESGTDPLAVEVFNNQVSSKAIIQRDIFSRGYLNLNDMSGLTGVSGLYINGELISTASYDGDSAESVLNQYVSNNSSAYRLFVINNDPSATLYINSPIHQGAETNGYIVSAETVSGNDLNIGEIQNLQGGHKTDLQLDYDFINDWVVVERDGQNNQLPTQWWDGVQDFRFNSANDGLGEFYDNDLSGLYNTDFSQYLGANIVGNKAYPYSSLNIGSLQANISYNILYADSLLDVTNSGYSSVLRNQIGNVDVYVDAFGLNDCTINREYSNREKIFAIDIYGKISSTEDNFHRWCGIVNGNAYGNIVRNITGCADVSAFPKYGKFKNCTIDWQNFNGGIALTTQAYQTWYLAFGDVPIDLTTNSNAYAEFFNDGSRLWITNIFVLD